jgi:phenylalanyl-tRNA synthetase beta chain
MQISEQWLREWVNPDVDTAELLRRVTMAGLEVDGTQPAANAFTGVIVGEVLACNKHPDADKLSVCSVSDGKSEFQVVCGAPNARTGIKVPFAQVGAVLGEDFKIKKAKLRGVESHGMLCSAEELGLAESADGLLELPQDAPVGQDIRTYLQLEDTLVEIDLTPNRGDCLSIKGLAREIGVLTSTAVTVPAIKPVTPTLKDSFPVVLESPQDCPRYLGRIIRNINPDVETPLWMQEKLRRCGLRSIDPVVDITNYVLMELGHPMHAFDFDRLQGGIKVRRAAAGEKLILLDGKEVAMTAETLVIADHAKAVAMAGVMGGKETAVGAATRNIFLESAFFNPVSIAGRARSYGMHTDAGHRYERGVDFELAPVAMERATALLLEIVGGEAGPVTEAMAELPRTAPVLLRRERIRILLGMTLPDTEVVAILQRLGLGLEETTAEGWLFSIPSWRFDIAIEADLIEELARVHGYDNLPVTLPPTRMKLQTMPEGKVSARGIKQALVDLGYQEVVTYSFVDRDLDQMLLETPDASQLALSNPISQDMAVMRGSLWPGLLITLKHNQNRQQNRLRLFESGLTFINKNKGLEQKPKVACLIWGAAAPEQWSMQERPVDFFDLKGDLELLTGAMQQISFVAGSHPALHGGQTARLELDGAMLGWVGALHPQLQQALDIPGKIFLAELDLGVLTNRQIPVNGELSRFPSVRRDLAVVLAQEITAGEVESVLRSTATELLLELAVFDVYQGDNIEKGKKSLALGLTFQHPSRTLADSDINPIIDSCIKALEAKFNAELR